MLFTKLNEQIELNNTLLSEVDSSEKEKVEIEMLFGNLVEGIISDLQVSEAKNV